MSLLNQVLQDLEKRNAENIPEQLQLSHVKAITTHQSRSYYLPFAILCLIAIIIVYVQNKPEIFEKHNSVKPNTVKKIVAVQSANNSINKKALEKPSVPGTVPSPHKAQALTTVQNNKQLIKSGKSTGQKKQPTEIKLQHKTIKEKPKTQAVKKLSIEQKAEQYFSLAEKQPPNNDKQKNLERAIQLNPLHINARLLLINTLLQQGLASQSAILLDQSLELFPQNLRLITLRSQLFLQKKQAQGALNVLHRIDENYVQDETYLSLLAAAYQQNNDNFNSLKNYQKLLKINPQKAEYWLGLAIALEKQDSPQQALDAYQHALNKKTLKPVIVSYIKQRISILK